MKLYGIPNCDTVKKARAWLNEHGKSHEFHDFKKHGVSAELLGQWVAQLGWEVLVNKQGTTWRKLDSASQAAVVDAASAISLMQAHPSLIKRPVLNHDGQLLVGFKPEIYAALP
ncbi:ArsC family reductase [Chitinimonas sp. BJB300]|uniref:ArsC family reductase n=1 Tax=Chitinimonas sp. BJB300 TaxID=1559339 RepID=UPI000C0F39B1|nr:ArsC family reductase [Chitinimonas sp. BJB300]PHV10301.1 ArsC family reductase [Chitinimonas sp. BJB300]TSJ90807.1 ArsC family reductase [Chitinimonas sp. BJB300]